MITQKKVSLYDKYSGFVDGYIFENGDLPNEDFDLMDWNTIDELIGKIILLKGNNASANFQEELKRMIQKDIENELVLEYLERLVDRINGSR